MFVDVTYAHFPFMPFYWPEGTFCCEVVIILIIGPTETQRKVLEGNVIKVTLIFGASRQSFSSHSGTNQDHCIMNGNSFTNQAFSSNGGLRLLHYLVLSAISRRANTNQITLFHWVFLWQSMNELHCTVTVHLTQHRPQLPV